MHVPFNEELSLKLRDAIRECDSVSLDYYGDIYDGIVNIIYRKPHHKSINLSLSISKGEIIAASVDGLMYAKEIPIQSIANALANILEVTRDDGYGFVEDTEPDPSTIYDIFEFSCWSSKPETVNIEVPIVDLIDKKQKVALGHFTKYDKYADKDDVVVFKGAWGVVREDILIHGKELLEAVKKLISEREDAPLLTYVEGFRGKLGDHSLYIHYETNIIQLRESMTGSTFCTIRCDSHWQRVERISYTGNPQLLDNVQDAVNFVTILLNIQNEYANQR